MDWCLRERAQMFLSNCVMHVYCNARGRPYCRHAMNCVLKFRWSVHKDKSFIEKWNILLQHYPFVNLDVVD